MIKPLIRVVLAAVAVLLLRPIGAQAWDVEASRAVGALAYERLTPPVRAKVDAILAASGPLGGETGPCQAAKLSDAAELVACLHGRRDDFMRGVAYDAISICDAAPKTQGCLGDRCASVALQHAIALLKAADTSPHDRALALEETAYLMAELHQPLHAADNGDRSGQRFRVALPGSADKRLTLYAVWDEDLVAEAIGDADTGLPYLRPLADAGAADWSSGDTASWLADSHGAAVRDVYGRLPVQPPCGRPPDQVEPLDRGYIAYGAEVVRTQLAKAAVRLAAVLNASLG